jgi:hypothetical protein
MSRKDVRIGCRTMLRWTGWLGAWRDRLAVENVASLKAWKKKECGT